MAADLAIAEDEHRAAETLLRTGHPRIAVTRGYFMAFRAARARLHAQGIEPGTPDDLHHLWNDHLVGLGRYEPSTARLLARLRKVQEQADEEPGFSIDEAGAREELSAARELVERIRKELEGGAGGPRAGCV